MNKILTVEDLEIISQLLEEGIVVDGVLRGSFELNYKKDKYLIETYFTEFKSVNRLAISVQFEETYLTSLVEQAIAFGLYDFSRVEYDVKLTTENYQLESHYKVMEDAHSRLKYGDVAYTLCLQILEVVMKLVEKEMYS